MDKKQTARITRLSIRNFLSLKKVDLELGKLNVFVGPNASGKSNIVRAFQLLANHARQGVPVLPGYREFKSIAYDFDETARIELELSAKIDSHVMRYKLLILSNNYLEKAWINGKEALSSEGRNSNASTLTRDGGTLGYTKPGALLHTNLLSVGVYRSALASLPSMAAEEIHKLAEMLKGSAVHSFVPRSIRATSVIDVRPELGYDGSGLARVLLGLYLEDRKAFEGIEDTLRSLIPEVEVIIPHLEGTNVELWLRVRGLREPLRPENISDGTLRVLAYITALYSGTGLAVFEEPENFVTIVDLARKAPRQVVMTTHSPYLLDYVKPEEVFVVEKPGTETIIMKVSKSKKVEAVKKLLEEGGTLGEAWYSGLVGGVPKSRK